MEKWNMINILLKLIMKDDTIYYLRNNYVIWLEQTSGYQKNGNKQYLTKVLW